MKWKAISKTKDIGGWGLTNIHQFGKALTVMDFWRLITNDGL